MERSSAHDRGECIPEYCGHPDHFLDDADVDLDLLIHRQLEPACGREEIFEGIEL